MAIQYPFDQNNTQLFINDSNGIPWQIVVDTTGNLQSAISGTTPVNLSYVPTSGGSMTGPLYLPVLSGTVISGGSIYSNGVLLTNYTLPSVINATVLSGTTISGGSIYSNGVLLTNYTLPSIINATVLSGTTISGGSIYQGGTLVATITDINNVSGISANALQVLTSSGIGTSLYNSKIGTTAYLNSISGLGTVTVFEASNGVVNISGSDYTLPTTINATVLSGTTISGNTIVYSTANGIIENVTTLNASVVSGTSISGNQIYINGQLITPYVYISGANYGSTEVPINFGTLPVNTANFVITDQRVRDNSFINAFASATPASGRVGYDDYQWDNITFTAIAVSGSFTVYAKVENSQTVVGNRTLRYTIF